ncbi:MAG: 2-succinyl-5-enolpyruvyl-6-hydroxy-3-cyclohexene-1-carboxylic-acid synthase [Pseudonocardia sp.]|nr:2-succinyl-5-enolpyruvyl-6-hydroxy-3-cyclohexene-1-carboxylic-acid synthase [Pseudonocardia sp.]
MNPSTQQAHVVVDELVRCGVTDAVLCPGSRNAPMSFALHAADAAGRLRLHVRIDERTAGFLALGLALRSGRPVPVCTTSGTAVANLHPAVLEASHAGVPLIALTADRPPELVGSGANQTIVQPGIFGGAVRFAASSGVSRSTVDRAVAAATGALGAVPGPVHLNLPFAEPLVPDGARTPVVTGATAVPGGRADGGPWTAVSRVDRSFPMLPLDPTAPTLVIAGHGGPALRASATTDGTSGAATAGIPIIAEPASPLWPAALRTGPWLLGSPALDALIPAQVVVAGRPTLHRPVQRLLADPDVAVYALGDPDGGSWTDVPGTVRAVGALPPLTPDPSWTRRWYDADAIATRALDAALDAAPAGLRLARALVAGLPELSLLVLGSSNPVRDVSLAAAPRPGLTVLANRGVAGIDGTVSTAMGAALAHGAPSYALLGDLTLLHDTTGLVIGPHEPRPDLTVVVLNDGGGGIFNLLEQGAPEHSAAFERVFGTPHDVDLAALCAAMGVAHTRLDVSDVADALSPRPGLRMLEVRADRAALRAGHAALRAAVNTALA